MNVKIKEKEGAISSGIKKRKEQGACHAGEAGRLSIFLSYVFKIDFRNLSRMRSKEPRTLLLGRSRWIRLFSRFYLF